MKKNIFTLFSVIILTLIFAGLTNAQTDSAANSKQTADKKLKILKKPFPSSRGCVESSGITLIRVTFDKSSKVTNTEIVKSSGCSDFDNNSLDAASRIKFEPQTKDGEPITVAKTVEYKYERY